MVGLDPTAKSFFLFLFIVLAYTFCLKMLYGIIAQLFPNKNNVLSFGTFLVLLFSLFSGFIVSPDTLPTYCIWFYYANPMAWAFQALLLTEFTSAKYYEVALGGLYGDNFLTVRGFPVDPVWIWYGVAFLLGYLFITTGILSVVLTYVRIQPIRNEVKPHKVVQKQASKEKDDFNLPFTPVDLTFEDLVYEVKASTGNETLRLLNTVSGVFGAGRLCALMGSSGAGVS
jgi:hypothetical protein